MCVYNQILELRSIISAMGNLLDGIKNKTDRTGETIIKFEDTSTEIFKLEHRKHTIKRKNKKLVHQ